MESPARPSFSTPAACFVLTGVMLSALAAVTSLELDNDSYEHFTTSVHLVRTWDVQQLILNIWNKPLPGLLYGVPGILGIWWARLASILVTLSLTWCVRDVWKHVSRAGAVHPAVAVVTVVLQTAVLSQAYVTMTELPAALLLAAGLCLHVRGRDHTACIVWGCAPLARMETLPLVAASIMLVHTTTWREGGRTLRQAASGVFVAALPCVAWWLLGVWFSGSWTWIVKKSYASLRPWNAASMLTVNAVSGLPGALTLPMIFLGIYGALSWRRLVEPVQGYRVARLLLAWLAVHLTLMSVMVVYPSQTYAGIGIAAMNDRNYNVLASSFALFVIAGSEAWVARLANAELPSTTRGLAWSAFLGATVTGVGFFWVQRAMGVGTFGTYYKLALGVSLLCGFLLMSRLASRGQFGRRARATWRSILLAGLAVCTFATSPFFWYPLRWQDQRTVALAEVCSWIGTHAPPTRILQDLSGGLSTYCALDAGTSASWIWPTSMGTELESAPAGSWLLVETDTQGNPRPRYPPSLLRMIDTPPLVRELRRYHAAEPARWQQWVNRFSWRNPPVGWNLYARAGSPAAAPSDELARPLR